MGTTVPFVVSPERPIFSFKMSASQLFQNRQLNFSWAVLRLAFQLDFLKVLNIFFVVGYAFIKDLATSSLARSLCDLVEARFARYEELF